MASGIYKITNTINNLVYIGQAKDINRRLIAHRCIEHSPNALEYNNQIHTAMRQYGIENFKFETIEECPIESLNEREKYWIAYYNSYKNGYNGTEGGDFKQVNSSGEANERAYMTTEEVAYIRECYNNHINFRDVYAQFAQKATKRCIQKIWYFETWPDIHPEYNTEENKIYHKTRAKANSSEVARNNKRAFSSEEVREMRNRFNSGESIQEIWKTTYPEKAKSTIYNVIHKITYKDID